jgi:putative SOS response-associated peptidase YedK
LERSQIAVWLEGGWKEARNLAETYQGFLNATRMSSLVNNNRHNGPELLEPFTG